MSGDPFDMGEESLNFDGQLDSTASVYGLNDEEIRELIMRAESGDSDAAFRLYQFYRFSKMDMDAAIVWLSKSAELGNSTAVHNLEVIKRKSEGGVIKKPEK